MDKKENFLIISGNGRNTGKTSFACRVIATVSKKFPVLAIKVSPHFHSGESQMETFHSSPAFSISIETDPLSNKDSARMLSAGAKKVFYVEVKDDHLQEALLKVFQLLPPDVAVICESGGMRHFIEPGLFIMMNHTERLELKGSFKKLSPLADRVVMFNGNTFDLQAEKICFDGIKWLIT